MANGRLTERNAAISAMLADGEQLKNFYRFTAQNPHINLHDACQISIERPNATVCYSFNEWAAMGRRITKGRKGIAYYDVDGYKQFVFDANDTHGDTRYTRPILPMKRLLGGLDELNGTEIEESEQSDYGKVRNGVQRYLQEQGELSGEAERDGFLIDGIAYSLYSKTGFPKSAEVKLGGLPYSYSENAEFVKDVYIRADMLVQDIEEAYRVKQGKIKVIDDTDEETVSDEPTLPVGHTENIVKTHSAIISNYKGYDVLLRWTHPEIANRDCEVYIGKRENYDNSDNSLLLISTNENIFSLLSGSGWTLSQQEMIDRGYFTERDYKEFYELENGILKDFEKTGEIKFGIDIDKNDSGVPFRYPNWRDEKSVDQTGRSQEPKHPIYPLYKRYLDAQKLKPQAIVIMRLGDFYEIMGENAKVVAEELDITLTGREVGLPERIPMCGVPYHALDKYLDKILEKHDVLKADGDGEPIYIRSHAEIAKEKLQSELMGIPDNEPTPFDEEQSETDDDWRSELAAELGELTAEQSENEVEETETDDNVEFDETDLNSDEQEEEPKVKGQKESTQKKPEKGIKDRKREDKPQLTLFDLTATKEKSEEEALIERQLKYGSQIEHGKFRIFEKYQENPTIKTFAEFLKDEYGWGGHGGWNGDDVSHDKKGIVMSVRGAKGEYLVQVSLKWPDVAVRIADLIDDDNYFTEQEKKEYVNYIAEQNRLREQRAEQEHRKNKFIDEVIYASSPERKQRILDEYAKTTKLTVFSELLKNEYGTFEEQGDGYYAIYNAQGIWINKGKKSDDYTNRIYLNWNEFADKVCTLIENDCYIEQIQPQELEQSYDLDTEEKDDNAENTDLTGVLDQSELGGAKTRFKGNVAAIKLVNKLYSESRNPTEAEKKVLSQFVGWGGLSQAFDENNPQWAKEYAELKTLLSQEDYEQARSSTLNAYYTAKDVIGGIYSALDRFGVKGNNRILEPSMGTGNFFGFMPKAISDGSRLYGVELDNLTGRIAAKLYPQANVQIKGFEDTSFPNDKFDIVVGNVPFGGYGVADSDYNRYNFKVHDYFLAKSIDKVKRGGIVAIVTSKGTMDKLNPSARKYVAERAELLGAIRLPNTAFKQTAGTEAVADILFFRKREEKVTEISDEDWLGTDTTEEGYEINRYFIKRPEMVLGTLVEETGLYGGVDVTVKPDGRELSEAIAEAVKNLPSGFYHNPETAPAEESTVEVDYNVKPMCYKAENGRLYMRVGDEMQEQAIPKFPKDAYQRIQGMIALREELHHILDLQIQGCSDEVLEREQRRLNAQYDLFVRRYGELSGKTNTRLFGDDGDSALLFACEEMDEETKKVSKSDIFFKRTIRPYLVPTSTDDCFEALQISKNERGRVDISYIEELTGKSYDDVLFELGDSIFRNPETTDKADKYSGFETAEEYLSGKVVTKLNTARGYAEQYPEYQRNVTALEKVQPTPLTASEISVRLGQTWVDKEFYKQFYMELIGANWWHEGSVELFYNPHDSSWRLDQKESVRNDTQMKQKEVYGTKRAPAYRLFIDCMNLKATTIYDIVLDDEGREKRVLNQAETIAAREKQNKIKEEFANWIFANPERREELEATYNRLFNRIRLPSYDGSYLKFPEMNPAIELRPHQKNAIHRIITSNQSTLLHHVVGSGKTYTMAASIMKMRQLGLCKKAMVAVPNHLVQQWASEWRKLYPNAKILVATKEDLEKHNRQKFVSKVALGDWDGIIIAQSSFAKIPLSKERQIRKLNEEILSVELTIEAQWHENGMPRGAVKNLERIKKAKQAQLKKLMDDKNKDSVLTFENLGVDYLYVDEAHYYKNLFLFTKMNNVAGISNAASQRASDLKLKCEYLQELHGNDRGIVFATGTPISNSMAEMYTMQSYLQPATLKESGIEFFDGWAADFGETITSMELAPSGQGYKARTRFAKFTNLPELLTMYRSFSDVQTADTVKLNVPEAERHVINLKPSDTVIELAEKIAERAEAIHGGNVPPEEDNMLKVTSDGKKLALDPRCFVPDSEDEEGSKLNEAAQRIFGTWEGTAEKKGTQIVFCDLSTPKVKSGEYIYGLRFDAYNDLKYKLVQKGIPADEIAFIHDAHTDEQKQALFDSVNSGAIRVLIGSTEKCGAGTNVQKRLVALHHLDTPYRPSDMEQREGRIIRQGNTNEKVDIYTYVTERTFDSYSYQILENKQKFIAQINRGDLTVREAEDIDETTLNYAEIKAITAANPRIKRKMEVDTEIARLRVLEGQYRKNLYDLQDKIRKDFPEDIRKQELLIERVTLDLMHLQASKPENIEAFEISVNGRVYTDRKEGGKALTDALYASKPETTVAEYCGFKIGMNPMTMLTGERDITLTANGQYVISIGESASGNLTRLDNFLEDFPKRKERLENRLAQLKSDLEIAKEQVEKPFEHKEYLAELLKEQSELNAELNLDKKEESVIIDDGNDSGDDENYRMIPTQRDIKGDKIIDEEDKVAAMKVELLPDYSITQDDMYEYGYHWDGMLPLNRTAALRLWGTGLSVCKLGKDDDHVEVDDYADFDDDGKTIYGIEKPVWNSYLHNEKTLPYLMARLQIAVAAKQVTSEDLSGVDERFTIGFIEANYKERTALEAYLSDKPKSDAKEMKVYVPQLTDEFSRRIWRDELKYYGWMPDDVPKAIANHIANNELKSYAMQVIRSTQVSGIDYRQAVIDSVLSEYGEFEKEMSESTPQDVFNNHYKIHCFERLSNVLEEDTEYFSDEDYKALYEDKGQILDKIFNEYILSDLVENNSPFNLDSYDDTVKCIQNYCRENHSEVYYSATYYGKDTENRAYYRFVKPITKDSLKYLRADAEMHTITAPDSELTQDELESKHIFYLKIGRDISEDALEETNAMSSMMSAMDSYYRIYPVYLQTAKYANEHYEMIDYRNSHKSNEECKRAIAEAISANYDGMHLNVGFEDKLIEKYGMERVAFIVATTVNEHDYDGRYSRENKEWAKTIPMSESGDERSYSCLNVHPAVLDAFTDRIKNKQIILYATVVEENSSGKPCYNAYFLDKGNGEIRFLLGDFSSDSALQATVDQDAEYRYKGYTFKRIEHDKLKKTSESIKEKFKDKEKGMAQDKYIHFTARGDKVLSITKDRDDRNIAVIHREEKDDFVVAARYDTANGTWGQARYDFKTLADAEKYRADKYGFENTEDTEKKKWVKFKISPEALIKKYQFNSRFRMPTDSGYEGCSYSVFNDRIKESTFTTDLKSDTRERALEIRIPENETVAVYDGSEKVIDLDAHKFIGLVNGSMSDKYEREQRYAVAFPPEAVIKEYETSMLLAMPNDTQYKGYVYYLPASVISEDKYKDDGTLIANIGESFKVTLRKGEEKTELTAKEYAELVGDKSAENYKREPSESDEYRGQQDDDKRWNTVSISESAVIANYENSTLFKMPKGQYEGYVYYIPGGMVRKENDGLYLRIPEDFEVHLKNSESGDVKDLTAQDFIAAMDGKTDDDYKNLYRMPRAEAKKQFKKVEARLRKNVPEEMRNKPNWVVVRTRANEDTGRLDKFLIDVHTGKFAESDNPETWSDFDTACKYAEENGGVALAYALDGEDGIACIDLDGCIDEKGNYTEIANRVLNNCGKTYIERSVSGKGLHIFGKTKGTDLRSFSKDKTMEYYQGGHFIAMTGDGAGYGRLESFDTPDMKSILESKLEKRTEWKNTGKGVEGLSSMSDREMLDKAFDAKNGNTVKRLYNGEDLRGNHSNSDMSLMNYLAFWSRHDIDQMLRVFATSGLYRPEKAQSYYECTAIKAVKGTPCYTPPKVSNNGNKPTGKGNGSGKDGK